MKPVAIRHNAAAAWFYRAAAAFLLTLVLAPAALRADSLPPPVLATIPSAKPSGVAEVDSIRILYFATAAAGPHPAIVLLPPFGSDDHDRRLQKFAAYLAERGIAVALMTLPYHGERWPKSENRGKPDPGLYFTSGDPVRNARSFAQAASDASATATWLLSQPGTDASRIGIGGISLGAIVTHIAMGEDARFGVGVAMLGSGDLPDLYRHSFFSKLGRLLHPSTRPTMPLDQAMKELFSVDPLARVDQNRPRRVFMVEGARDIVIPPRDATELWNALGRPPIRWLDSSHYGLSFNRRGAEEAAWQYYQSAWGLNGTPVDSATPPPLSTLTIKLGFIAQAHESNSLGITSALTWQAVSFGHRPDHMAVAHADLGITGRGPFVGVAATVTPYIDLGFASRIGRTTDAPKPYIGLHLTF